MLFKKNAGYSILPKYPGYGDANEHSSPRILACVSQSSVKYSDSYILLSLAVLSLQHSWRMKKCPYPLSWAMLSRRLKY